MSCLKYADYFSSSLETRSAKDRNCDILQAVLKGLADRRELESIAEGMRLLMIEGIQRARGALSSLFTITSPKLRSFKERRERETQRVSMISLIEAGNLG